MRAAALLALLLVPTASACSFAAEPPTPAMFTLVPNDGGAETHLRVGGRMSGADCGLANPFAFDDGVFAWLEVEWNPRVDRVHLHDLATRERSEAKLVAEHVDGFGLWDGKLLYRGVEHAKDGSSPPVSAFYVHDARTGKVETLDMPNGNYPSVVFDGPLIAAILRPARGADTLHVFDVSTGRFVVEGRSLADISDRGTAHLQAAGDGWIALSGDETLLYEMATGEMHPVRVGVVRSIHDGHAWGWDHGRGAYKMRLPDGPVQELVTKGPVVGFVPGHVVLGQFSPPQLREPEAVPVSPVESFERPSLPFGLLARVAFLFMGPLGLLGALLSII